MSILILAEHDNQQLKEVTYHAVTAALQFKQEQEIDILVMGWKNQQVAEAAAKLSAIRKVWQADGEVYEHQLAENTAALLAELGRAYHYIIATATTFSKNILPRVAALLNVSMISDVIAVQSADTFVRPMFAGNVLATVQSFDPIKVITVRNTAFPAAQPQDQTIAVIDKLNQVIINQQASFASQCLSVSERPELTSARIILSGGRGLKSADNFKRLEVIADRLGAAIGASRAAVDAGYISNDHQVGQTGKIVAPDLYIAIGISGAIQHLAGMKDSKIIVAINNDPDAPIFQSSDYILVGDLFKILPELEEALTE